MLADEGTTRHESNVVSELDTFKKGKRDGEEKAIDVSKTCSEIRIDGWKTDPPRMPSP